MLDLEARIAIAQGQPRQALDIYKQLDSIAREADSPDGRLRAALGSANATSALGDRDQALGFLAEADRWLDGVSLRIPLHEGRETFVSQREGAASLEVQLLLDAGYATDVDVLDLKWDRVLLEAARRVVRRPPDGSDDR